jgi:SAM-dependent methyltransferase
MPQDYAYDQAWSEERARLAGIEALWDEGTRALLTRCGVRSGAVVLEVGAGGGSVVSWLADTVGPGGRVFATDIDTRFVDPLASEVVTVRQADLVTDDLPAGEFDVVHTRLLLEHLSQRDAAVDRLIAALRPGGWLVIEDYDWTSFGFEPDTGVERRAADAVMALMARSGFEALYGRRVTSELSRRGLVDVRGEGRSLVIDSAHPGFAFFRLSFEQLGPVATQAGLLSDADLAGMRAQLATGTATVFTPTLMAAVGRRPADQAQ